MTKSAAKKAALAQREQKKIAYPFQHPNGDGTGRPYQQRAAGGSSNQRINLEKYQNVVSSSSNSPSISSQSNNGSGGNIVDVTNSSERKLQFSLHHHLHRHYFLTLKNAL